MADTTDSKSVAFRREGSSPSSRTVKGDEMSKKKEYDIKQVLLWPIVIVQDRYQGIYTGGKWVAIPQADLAPSFETTVWGDDCECMEWVADNIENQKTVGVGGSPQEAYDDLLSLSHYQDPKEELRKLREAVKKHKQTVTSAPERTAEAEDELWKLIE